MLKPKKGFIQAQLNIEKLSPLQWDGILRAMDAYAEHYHEEKVNELSKANVSGMLPINDAQIRCYGLLQLIAKAEMAEPSPYNPENEIRKRNIANWKQEYYTLIGNFR